MKCGLEVASPEWKSLYCSAPSSLSLLAGNVWKQLHSQEGRPCELEGNLYPHWSQGWSCWPLGADLTLQSCFQLTDVGQFTEKRTAFYYRKMWRRGSSERICGTAPDWSSVLQQEGAEVRGTERTSFWHLDIENSYNMFIILKSEQGGGGTHL